MKPLTTKICQIGCLFILMAACKTTTAKTKDAETDAIKQLVPQGLVSRPVPSDGIEKYVAPGDGKNGVPDSLSGLWWTDAKTIQYVISFKNSLWNDTTRTATIIFSGPGMYSTQPHADDGGAMPRLDDDPAYKGYDVVLSQDFKSGKLLETRSDDGNRSHSDPNYTMELVADGDWLRHTPGKPDYHLRRIVNKDGTRNADVYKKFLSVFGDTAMIDTTSINLSSDHPVDLTLQPGAPDTIIAVRSANSDVPSMHVYADADFPLTLHQNNINYDSYSSFNGLDTFAYGDTIISVNTGASVGGKVHFSVEPDPVLTWDNSQQSFPVAFAKGRQIGLLNSDAFLLRGYCEMTARSTAPIIAEIDYQKVSSVGNTLTYRSNCISFNQFVMGPLDRTDASATVSIVGKLYAHPAPVDLVIGKGAIDASLDSTVASHLYRVPGSVNGAPFKLRFNAESRPGRDCCVQVIEFYASTPPSDADLAYRFGGKNAAQLTKDDKRYESNGRDHWFEVLFGGGIGVAQPNLHYTLEAVAAP